MGSAFPEEVTIPAAVRRDECVLCAHSAPDYVAHRPHADCANEAPHLISACGLFGDVDARLDLAALLRRYLDQHCAASDQDGLGALCECRICQDTRRALAALPAPGPGLIDAEDAPAE